MAISYNTTGSAGSGTLEISGDGSLTLADIVANQDASAMTDDGEGNYRCDRYLHIRPSSGSGITLTTENEQLTVVATGLTAFNVLLSITPNGADMLWIARNFTLVVSGDRPNFMNLFGVDGDTNHGNLDWENCFIRADPATDPSGSYFIRLYRGTANEQIVDSSFGKGVTGRIGGASSNYKNNTHYDGSALAQLTAINEYSGVRVVGGNYVVSLNSAISLPATYSGYTGEEIITATVQANPNTAGNVTYRMLNMVSNLGRSVDVTSKPAGQIVTVEWAYLLTSRVVDETDSLQDNVRRCVFDGAGNLLDNSLSVSGLWSDLQVVHSEDECESGAATTTDNGPFEVRYYIYGYNERRDTGLALDASRADDFKNVVDAGIAEASKAAAAAYSGISYTPSTGNITLSGAQTPQKVHDYVMSQFGETGVYTVQTTFRPIQLSGTSFATLSTASVTITGTLSSDTLGLNGDITVDGGTTNAAISGDITITGAATIAAAITPDSGTSVTFPSAATFSGTITIGSGATATFDSDTQASGGTLEMTGGTVVYNDLAGAQITRTGSAPTGTEDVSSVTGTKTLDLRGASDTADFSGTTIDNSGTGDITIKIGPNQTAPALNNTGSGSLAVDSDVTHTVNGLQIENIAVYDDSNVQQDYQATVTGSTTFTAPASATGTWTLKVRRQGYTFSESTFDPLTPQTFNIASTERTTFDGSSLYTGSSTALLTVVLASDRYDIGDGTVTAQEIFDGSQDALVSSSGMDFDDCLNYVPTSNGDYVRLLNLCQLRRRAVSDSEANLAAIVDADAANIVDTTNGDVSYQFDSQAEVLSILQKLESTIELDGVGPSYKLTSAALADVTSQTDQLTFTGGDLHATLDGEEVTTDAASRTASQADVSALATQASIDALNDFDPANDTVAHVTLVDTTTANTDMRGTDGANTIAPDNAGIASTLSEATLSRKRLLNRDRIDQDNSTLTVYEDDGTTPFRVFDLKDPDGAPSTAQIFEKDPQ